MIAPCPESFPNAYFYGQYCCASDYEKVNEIQGNQCNGSRIQLDSLCCNGAYTPCPNGLCIDNDQWKLDNAGIGITWRSI